MIEFLVSLVSLIQVHTQSQQSFTPQDVQNELQSRPTWVQCIVHKEIGRGITRNGIVYPPYDPYMPGLQGEQGPVQLHPSGLLIDFYASGFTNPYSPIQSMDYLELAASRNLLSHWPTSKGC